MEKILTKLLVCFARTFYTILQRKCIHQWYLLKQRKIFGLDFDDLIHFTWVLFYDFAEVLEKWQKNLHYVQVDEFQDSSPRQIELIELVARREAGVFRGFQSALP